jgi:hypothetical protein
MLSVYDGRVCVGWIISRGPRGFEAFDSSERSLGTFETQREAAASISAAAEGADGGAADGR